MAFYTSMDLEENVPIDLHVEHQNSSFELSSTIIRFDESSDENFVAVEFNEKEQASCLISHLVRSFSKKRVLFELTKLFDEQSELTIHASLSEFAIFQELCDLLKEFSEERELINDLLNDYCHRLGLDGLKFNPSFEECEYGESAINNNSIERVFVPVVNHLGVKIGDLYLFGVSELSDLGEYKAETLSSLQGIISLIWDWWEETPVVESIKFLNPTRPRKTVMIGQSESIVSMRKFINKTKFNFNSILVEGSIGSGRSLYAKILHEEGVMKSERIFEFNCQVEHNELTISDHLKLLIQKLGKGTLFIKNIDFLDLQQQEFVRSIVSQLDREIIRLIVSSDTNLSDRVKDGHFSKDLYSLISEMSIEVPSLNERREDIPLLVKYFVEVQCQKRGIRKKLLGEKYCQHLMTKDWSFNVRELAHFIEHSISVNLSAEILTVSNSHYEFVVNSFEDQRSFFESELNKTEGDHNQLVESYIKAEIDSAMKQYNGDALRAAAALGVELDELELYLLQGVQSQAA